MSAFDKVIGYETIKNELTRICDMVRNRKAYEELGAKLPQGILIYGEPGLGKTLLANCLIEESGLPAYTLRRDKKGDDFVERITDTFAEARKNAPAVMFLDDLDKFANEDANHRDAEEYVAVQAGIDASKGTEVLVIATANDVRKLPDSLKRSGRFDRKIELWWPNDKDAREIIRYYLSDKKVAGDVDVEDLAAMLRYSSCADLETVLNEAAIVAAGQRKDRIGMQDLVESVLRMQYNSPDDDAEISYEGMRSVAMHEAGHLVASEVLFPGSVGLASVRSQGRDERGGFTRRCADLPNRRSQILVALAGKAAVEMHSAETCASGCGSDIHTAAYLIRGGLAENATGGFVTVDVDTRGDGLSETLNARTETAVQAELERYLMKAKDLLLKNKDFLEQAAEALAEKKTLLHSDIRKLRENAQIVRIEF